MSVRLKHGAGYVSDLDTPLLRLSEHDVFTLRDAVQGVQVFGGIGSGKSSGTGKALAQAYLRAGMGGLVLCAKPDEVETWCRYAYENGRAKSVYIFGKGAHGFNFTSYELERHGVSGLATVVDCVKRILTIARQTNPDAGRSGDAFWDDLAAQLIRNSVVILYAAAGAVRIPDIVRFVATAPNSEEQVHDANWQASSFMFQMLKKARKNPALAVPPDELTKASTYWRETFSQLDSKTRGNGIVTVSAALDRFSRGRLYDAFCTNTTVVPEMTFQGAIILMDMSVTEWNEDGLIGQQLFKYMWQRAVLTRNGLAPEQRDRPVFLFADESQNFVNSFDVDYQTMCRSSKACTVYMTQSMPTYMARLSGKNPKAEAEMLLACFGHKVFHSIGCYETAKFASDMIGRRVQLRGNQTHSETYGTSHGMSTGENTSWGTNSGYSKSWDAKGDMSHSVSGGTSSGGGENSGRNRGFNSGETVGGGTTEVMDYIIEPGEFGRSLLTGGPANGNIVSAVWYQAGRNFRASNLPFVVVRFAQ